MPDTLPLAVATTDDLLARLRAIATDTNDPNMFPACAAFVLRHGRPFGQLATSSKAPPWMRKPNQCFVNCLQAAYTMPALGYVEGFATTGADLVHHAWCVDADGRIHDFTWGMRGVAYFGVPFARSYLVERYDQQARTGFTGSLLITFDDRMDLLQGRQSPELWLVAASPP
ncbi:MAG: hypothetical protein ACHREM_08165 [Polyangiales bacterium]